MENKLIHLIAQLESLRHEYYDIIKIIDLKGYSEHRAMDISVELNRICARMLAVQADINEIIHKLMKGNMDIHRRIKSNLKPKQHIVMNIFKGVR